MTKIPIILESGRADGKLIKTDSVYDDNQNRFVSDILEEFKDRDNTNGMGYIILRKNKSFAEQVTKESTIYEIRYDFNLNGTEITIPNSCILKFEGGSLINGTINGNNTVIESNIVKIFNNINLTGKWNVLEAYPEWFGAMPNTENIDNAIYINKSFELSNNVKLSSSIYYITTYINLKSNFSIIGVSREESIIRKNENSSTLNTIINIEDRSSKIEICNLKLENLNYGVDYGIHANGLSQSRIDNVEVFGCKNGIYIVGDAVWNIMFTNVISNCNSLHQEDASYGYNNSVAFKCHSTKLGGTSLVFNKCWGRDCYNGFNFQGINYSTMTCTGVDNCNGLSFTFKNSYFTLNSCSCENIYATVKYKGCMLDIVGGKISILGFYTYDVRNNDDINETNGINVTDNGILSIYDSNFSAFTHNTSKLFNINLNNGVIYSFNSTLPSNGNTYIGYTNNSRLIIYDSKGYYIHSSNGVYKINTKYHNEGITRPECTVKDAGFVFYDKSINKVILWNGNRWVNLDGSSINTSHKHYIFNDWINSCYFKVVGNAYYSPVFVSKNFSNSFSDNIYDSKFIVIKYSDIKGQNITISTNRYFRYAIGFANSNKELLNVGAIFNSQLFYYSEGLYLYDKSGTPTTVKLPIPENLENIEYVIIGGGFISSDNIKLSIIGESAINPIKEFIPNIGNKNPSSQLYIGRQFFNSTLNKPLWYNGTSWVDATGATV